MDQSKETKSGIFNALKKRLWTKKLSNKSCFKGKSPKLKHRSDSSHCNFTSSSTNVISSQINLSQNVFSASAPNITNCIVESNPYETIQSESVSEEKELCRDNQNITVNNGNNEHETGETNFKLLCSTYLNIDDAFNTSDSLPHQRTASSTVENQEVHEMCNTESENASYDPKSGLMSELLKLSKYGWYWGSFTKEEAEEKLTDQPDGAFLLRDSSADHFILSLSFRSSGKTLHTRIEYILGKGQFSFYHQGEESFSSIAELVEHSMSKSQSSVYCYSRPRSPGHPAFPVRLTKPISRFAHVWSLQHLCRFVIRESIRIDNIQKLPLPSKIKGYIEEGHY